MNKVELLGRIVREPNLEYSATGNAYLRNAIAVPRWEKDKADFFNISIFGKSAEAFYKHLHKGSKIALVGRLQSDSYTDKNGNKVTSVSVIVDEWEFAESKSDKTDTSGGEFLGAGIPDFGEELPFS